MAYWSTAHGTVQAYRYCLVLVNSQRQLFRDMLLSLPRQIIGNGGSTFVIGASSFFLVEIIWTVKFYSKYGNMEKKIKDGF